MSETLGGRPLHTTTLDNGLRVVCCQSKGAAVAAIQVWVGVGAADEAEHEGGLAHVHEHMLFKGTLKDGKVNRGVGEIAAEIERAGGEVNAWTSYDQTVYHVVIASRFFDTGLAVLADAVQNSAFDKDELSRELEVILEEIKRSEDQPSSKVSRAMFAGAFQKHPYRRPVIGYADVVRGFTRDDVTAFFNAHYKADRITVVVVSDLEIDDVVGRVRGAFGAMPSGARRLADRPTEGAHKGLTATGLTDDVEESHLALAFRGPALLDADMPALDVLGVILGQGESSRLQARVKRELQVANEAYAYAYTPKDPGLFVVGATLNHENLDACIDALGAEIRRAIDEPPTARELSKAKAQLASEAIYQRETVEGLARRIGTWTLHTDDPAFETRYQERVAQVTAADVQSVAGRFLVPASATVVALVPKGQEARVDSAALAARATQALEPQHRVKARRTVTDRVTRAELACGAKVIVEEDRGNPFVTVRTAWLGGLRAETDDTAGYTHLLAEMLSRGTERRSADEVAERADAMAGSVDGFAGRNSFGMRGTFLRPHLEHGLELYFECLREPAFSEGDLERVRAHTLEDIRAKNDNPAGLAFDLFGKTLWRKHPYRRDVLGSAASVKAVTPQALRQFYATHGDPARAVFTFVGDISADEAIASVEAALHGVRDGGAPGIVCGVEPTDEHPAVVRLTRPRAQAHLVTGVRGLALSDPDRHALEVVSTVLSGQGGRLFLELRDKQSLCYSVSAFAVEGLEPGSFAVYMGTSPEKVDTALAGIDRLLAAVVDEGITAAELSRARRYLTGSHEIGLQRLGSRATAMALNELYGLGHLSHRDVPARIEAVTLEDTRRAARRVLGQPGRVTVLVGPEGTGGPAATLKDP